MFEDESGVRARPKISLLDEDIEPTVLTAESGGGKENEEGLEKEPEGLFQEEEDHSELLE